jgi:hypothetical protein
MEGKYSKFLNLCKEYEVKINFFLKINEQILRKNKLSKQRINKNKEKIKS